MRTYFSILLFLICINAYSKSIDTLQIQSISNQMENLENQVKEIRRDELNYALEKNLLKETYSNNYERISQVITIVLGIIGLFGYLGLKDINSIKKEYTSELSNLNKLKAELESKINSISETQIKYEKEISEIIKQNEEQTKQIKLLEFHSRIKSLRSEKKYPAALENCILALQLDPDNLPILLQKAIIYVATLSYNEGITTYKKIIELDPKNEDAIMNLCEAYIFNKQHKESEKLINDHPELYKTNNGEDFLILRDALILFNKNKKNELITEIQSRLEKKLTLTQKKGLENWGLNEAISYVDHSIESSIKPIMKSYLEYLEGEITGEELKKKIS